MQSTGQTVTQAVSLAPMQGWAITCVMTSRAPSIEGRIIGAHRPAPTCAMQKTRLFHVKKPEQQDARTPRSDENAARPLHLLLSVRPPRLSALAFNLSSNWLRHISSNDRPVISVGLSMPI